MNHALRGGIKEDQRAFFLPMTRSIGALRHDTHHQQQVDQMQLNIEFTMSLLPDMTKA